MMVPRDPLGYARRMVRLLIADDHQILLEGVRSIIASQPDIEIVAEETNGERALESIRRVAPDVALLDIEMPGLSGIEVTRRVVAEKLPTRIVILSAHAGKTFVSSALEAGIGGYVLKEDAPGHLLAAIRANARHELYLSAVVTQTALSAAKETAQVAPLTHDGLSPRERDVVRLLAEGLSSKEIAEALCLTPKTVDTYRQNIMTKLGLKNVASIVRYAVKHQIVSAE